MLALTVKCGANLYWNIASLNLNHNGRFLSRCFDMCCGNMFNRVILSTTPKRTYCNFKSLEMDPLCSSGLPDSTSFENRKNVSSALSNNDMPHFVPHMEGFDASYQDIISDLTVKDTDIPTAVAARLKRIMDYNVLGGKQIRGLCVVLAYHLLSENSPKGQQEMKLANILGWCVEMLQGYFIICDDIIDDGKMRRGKLCWFRLPDVGLESLNDAMLLQSSIYKLLKIYFSSLNCYDRILDEFLEVTRKTIYGQTLDMIVNPTKRQPVLEKFTLDHYRSTVYLKTSHYTFCLPVHLAMHLIGSFNKNDYEVAEALCLKLGYLFQMQDDYLDIYGKVEKTGKSGCDIKEGKCTWFSAAAVANCTEDQKRVMKENYGFDDSNAIQRILQLYDAMSLKEKYLIMEKKLHAEISSLISGIDRERSALNSELFRNLLDSIYRREK